MKKGFGQLFSESLKEYGSKFVIILKSFLFLYFIPVAIIGILALIVFLSVFGSGFGYSTISGNSISNLFSITGFSTLTSNTGNPTILLWIIPLAIILFVILLVLITLLNICYINIGFFNKEKSFKNVFNRSKKYFWKYIGLSLLIYLCLVPLYLLLIIPGIIFSIYWIFAFYVLVRENTGIWESMKRSKIIVKGKWWKVFGYSLLLGLIIVAVSLVSNFIPFVEMFVNMLVLVPFTILFFKNFYLDLRTNLTKTKN